MNVADKTVSTETLRKLFDDGGTGPFPQDRKRGDGDEFCCFWNSTPACRHRAEYYTESYCLSPRCSEVHKCFYCAHHFAYILGWYMNLFETSGDDIDQCYEEAMLAGVIPSCLTLLDWHRVDGAE